MNELQDSTSNENPSSLLYFGQIAVISNSSIEQVDVLPLYRALLLPRFMEEKMLRLIRHGRISKWFSGYGQEATAVGCTWALRADDYILPTHRNLGVWTTRGVSLRPLCCQLMGKEGGFTKGRDRTFHFGLPEKHIIGMISHMAAMLPVACGLGQALQYKRSDSVAMAFCGDGATREGDFHEALNLAALWKLPVLFVVENNGYGLSTPTHEALAQEDIARMGLSYGMRSASVDGNDVLAVIDAVQSAAAHARAGEGPALLEMKTFRMRGHEESSGTWYVPDDLLDEWKRKDPITRFTAFLVEQGVMEEGELEGIREELSEQVEDAVEYALAQPEVTSTLAEERKDLFAPAFVAHRLPDGTTSEKRFIDAIQDALRLAMEQDERTLIMGQDIAEYGGVFKITKGFVEAFGKERIRNTPIIESGVVGAAMGLALEDLKPIVEIQYADFITCGFNQIVNNLATTHYRWGQPVNVTVRAPVGGNIGAGPFHSQSPEAWFCHVPGLKVVYPSTPHDAKGLLLAAIEEPNPVLFFEHKYLYRSLRGPVPDGLYHEPLGKARMVREGADATIISWGLGVHWALQEAEYQASNCGVSVEVVDLRTLVPWDRDLVLASVRKTNRVLVLHEATLTAGFGAEVVATISQKAFEHLDAPPVRVAAEDLPVPFSRALERDLFSASARLRPTLEHLLDF